MILLIVREQLILWVGDGNGYPLTSARSQEGYIVHGIARLRHNWVTEKQQYSGWNWNKLCPVLCIVFISTHSTTLLWEHFFQIWTWIAFIELLICARYTNTVAALLCVLSFNPTTLSVVVLPYFLMRKLKLREIYLSKI